MIIHDPKRFIQLVPVKWALSEEDRHMYRDFLAKDDLDALVAKIGFGDVPPDFDEYEDFDESQDFEDFGDIT